MKNKILFLPKYSAKGASSRYRIYSYLPYYEKEGYSCQVIPLLNDRYLDAVYSHHSKWNVAMNLVNAYIKRLWIVLTVRKGTLVYIGAEMLPYFPSLFEKFLRWKGVRYIIEFDDAVFHHYELSNNQIVKLLYANKYPKVIKSASAVICGCRYLADYTKQWNENVVIIPTCIDGDKYNQPAKEATALVVGWIGSPSSSKHVKEVLPAIIKLQEEIDFEFRLVGFDKAREPELSGVKYTIVGWKAETEVDELRGFTVGIMPLKDTPFARGKCAFKLVQYMAAGIPTVSTPLQSNVDIDRGCGNLFANNENEWYSALKEMLTNEKLRVEVGRRNKEIAIKYYTFQSTYQEKIRILESLE